MTSIYYLRAKMIWNLLLKKKDFVLQKKKQLDLFIYFKEINLLKANLDCKKKKKKKLWFYFKKGFPIFS